MQHRTLHKLQTLSLCVWCVGVCVGLIFALPLLLLQPHYENFGGYFKKSGQIQTQDTGNISINSKLLFQATEPQIGPCDSGGLWMSLRNEALQILNFGLQDTHPLSPAMSQTL